MFSLIKLDSNVRNAVKIGVGVVGVYWFYKTVKIYVMRRKYAHIPGPPTSG